MADSIYKIRIILDAEEDVFRDVAVEEHISLEDFHNAITQAFGFLGNEMASFFTCDEEWSQEEEIVLFPMDELQSENRRMSEVRLEEVISKDQPRLLYVYDFLNMWTFFVELADVEGKEEGSQYPMVLFSFGDIPDEAPEKLFEADSDLGLEDPIDNYDDLDFDENWN